jgi:RNA polymerase sigma-54 factor
MIEPSVHTNLDISQKQTQRLVITPQLRHSLKILQSPTLELRSTILEELQTNPALEELPMENISLEGNETSNEEEKNQKKELEFENNYEILGQEDTYYNLEENESTHYSSQTAQRRQYFLDSLTNETSLQEHLLEQAKLADISEEVIKSFLFLVGSLDDCGFIATPLPDIAITCGLPLNSIQQAHKMLKTFDPPGIGSMNLQDCLLTQLEQRKKSQGIAAIIIKDHFDLLLKKRIPKIAQHTGFSLREIQNALSEIAMLDRAPARKFAHDNNRLIEPDISVEKYEGKWIITLNNRYIPQLRLSQSYKNLLAGGKLNSEEKKYIQNKIRSGKFLISALEQRQQTLENITREILNFQKDFLGKGPSKLRTLSMNMVAQAIGIHETTVSRAIANKYIETPYGIFELKYFFTPGYKINHQDAISSTAIKERIIKLIQSEDSAKPYSDQKIASILKTEKNIQIARRTVAKYREGSGIAPTNLRRQYR